MILYRHNLKGRHSRFLALISMGAVMLSGTVARAQFEPSVEYLRPRFATLFKTTALTSSLLASGRGVPEDELKRCAEVKITGLSTWGENERPQGRPFYVWFPEGISVVCWEYFKEALPKKPFELVKGVDASLVTRITFNPFSDPGPSIFFYFKP